MLADALINSPIMAGEDGVPIGMGTASAFDLSMDPEDPELAMVNIAFAYMYTYVHVQCI